MLFIHRGQVSKADLIREQINHNFYAPITTALGLYEVCDAEKLILNPYEKTIRQMLRKSQARGRAFSKLLLIKQECRLKQILLIKRKLKEHVQIILNPESSRETLLQSAIGIVYCVDRMEQLNNVHIFKAVPANMKTLPVIETLPNANTSLRVKAG